MICYESDLWNSPPPDHFITAVLELMALQLGEINQAQSTLQSVLRSAGAGCERREGTEPEQAYHWNRFLGDLDSFRLQALMIKRAFFFPTAHPSSPRPPFISLSLLFLGLLQDSSPELISQRRHLVLLWAAVRALTIRLWIISLEHCFHCPEPWGSYIFPSCACSSALRKHLITHTHTFLNLWRRRIIPIHLWLTMPLHLSRRGEECKTNTKGGIEMMTERKIKGT